MVADYDARGQHQATIIYQSNKADGGWEGEEGEEGKKRARPGARSSESDDDEDPYLEFSTAAHRSHNGKHAPNSR
jgi:hypothetical protein